MSKKRDEEYWRGIVACAAEIGSDVITTSYPEGFHEAIGYHVWYYVKLGPLRLTRKGNWIYSRRKATLKQLLRYAFKTADEALVVLRKEVAPAEPEWAALFAGIAGRHG